MTRPISFPRERGAHLLSSIGLAEIAFFGLIMMVLAAPISSDTSSVADAGGLEGQGNAIRQLLYLFIFLATIYATGALNSFQKWKSVPIECYLVLALCWVSLIWAIEPGVGLRRIILLTIVSLSTFLSLNHLGVEKAFRQFQFALGIVCVLNFVAVAVAPQIGIHQADAFRDPALIGNWRGIFPEKNYTGLVCALTIIIFYLGPPLRSKWLQRAIILLAAVFLVQTNSKTSLALTSVALAFAFAYKFYNHKDWGFALIATATAGLILAVAVIWNWDQLLAPLDQQDTLTGRSQIWRFLIAYIQDHPILGSGYGSFWNIGFDSPVLYYTLPGSWVQSLASGHNGYLDVAAQLGVPGLLTIFYLLVVRPGTALFANGAFRNPLGSLLAALLVFEVGHNFTESTILDRDHLLNFVVLLVVGVTRRVPLRAFRKAGGASRWDRNAVPAEDPQISKPKI